MNIGVCFGLHTMEGAEYRLQELKASGFTSCQIVSWNPSLWTDENAEVLRCLFSQTGVTPSAFWCGWQGPAKWNFYEGYDTLGLLPESYRETRINDLCRGADFAQKLGITDVITHVGFIPENPADPQLLPLCHAIRRVAEHLAANGQYLLLETGQETPVAMLRCFELVAMPNMAVNLDTANLILYGKANPVDALDVIGRYVRNIHAKDGIYPVNGHDLGKETPIGQGRVDFHAFFRRLCALGYDSFVTIECELDCPEHTQYAASAAKYLSCIIDRVKEETTA